VDQLGQDRRGQAQLAYQVQGPGARHGIEEAGRRRVRGLGMNAAGQPVADEVGDEQQRIGRFELGRPRPAASW